MELKFIAGILSTLISVAAYWPYADAIFKGKAKPTVSTWIAWFLMDVAILGGMYAASAVAYQMVAYTVGTMFIIGVCLYKGAVMEWNRIDTACMVIVLVAIGLWYRTGDPNMAIMFSLVAIVVGTVPLLLKLRTNPEVEPLAPWILIIIGSVFGLIAIPAITIADAATPIVFFLIQATVLYLMLRSSRSAEVSKV